MEQTAIEGTSRLTVLTNARVVLGVTGGIAAYKAADLASKLVQAGAIVTVIMTDAARHFVGEATFESLTQRAVYSSVFSHWNAEECGHISLAKDADVVVVAPATANSIAKLAHGIADEMLGAVALASTAPLLIAPAMEHLMFHHPATQSNLALLRDRGAIQIGPERGHLASGEFGDGRLVPTEALIGEIRMALGKNGPLKGANVVITSGGTREALDPVRYIGNRSSGIMGHALAQAAIDAGARVTLVTAPTSLVSPIGVKTVLVTSSIEMRDAVAQQIEGADALIGAAAVADYRPEQSRRTKMKKEFGQDRLELALIRNPDILAETNRPGLIKIGFAAETEGLIAYAREKLKKKGLALIVANDAESTIGALTSEATILSVDGSVTALPRMPKADVAAEVIARLVDLISARNGD